MFIKYWLEAYSIGGNPKLLKAAPQRFYPCCLQNIFARMFLTAARNSRRRQQYKSGLMVEFT